MKRPAVCRLARERYRDVMHDNLYERLSGRQPFAATEAADASQDVEVSSDRTSRTGALRLAQPPGPRITTKRLRTPILAAIAVSVVVLGAAVVFTVTRMSSVSALQPVSEGSEDAVQPALSANTDPASAMQPPTLMVHVVGAVKNGGVYALEAGARVVDAIEAAGGATEDAELSAVNLARVVADGEQLRVPTMTEAAAQQLAAPSQGQQSQTQSSGALVNINSATQDELEGLPRVGPALAARIIDYREANGGFRSVDDLNAVSGIGEKLLESIRQLVTV